MRSIGPSGGQTYYASNDTHGADPNGLHEECILFAGAGVLANRQTPKQWKDQLLKFIPVQSSAAVLESVEPMLDAVGLSAGPVVDQARCP